MPTGPTTELPGGGTVETPSPHDAEDPANPQDHDGIPQVEQVKVIHNPDGSTTKVFEDGTDVTSGGDPSKYYREVDATDPIVPPHKP